MNEQVRLVLITTNLQMCSAEPNLAQLGGGGGGVGESGGELGGERVKF